MNLIYSNTTLMLLSSWTDMTGDSETMSDGFDQGTSVEEDTLNSSETEPNWMRLHWHGCQVKCMNKYRIIKSGQPGNP